MKFWVLVLASVAVSCGSSNAGDLCSTLGGVAGCTADAPQTCRDAISADKISNPTCAKQLDALATCMAGLELSCLSDGIAANPVMQSMDPHPGDSPDNFDQIGTQHIVLNDRECDKIKRGYDACRTCPAAAGALEIKTKGVGEWCGSTADCASGLQCQDSECTKSCTADADCKARAKDCHLLVQFENVCVSVAGSKRCTRSCAFGSDSDCQFYFAPNYQCLDKTCVPK